MARIELRNYMKPMISRTGIIASRRNEYFLRAVSNPHPPNPAPSNLPEIRPKSITKSTKSIRKGPKSSYFFRAIGRSSSKNIDSPPPNRYSPKYEILYKNTPSVLFKKYSNRNNSTSRSNSPSRNLLNSIETISKIPGIPFEKQLSRKALKSKIFSEKSPEAEQRSIMMANKVHSFSHYTYRKPLHKLLEFQPEYSPKYEFVSKPLKSNYLVD